MATSVPSISLDDYLKSDYEPDAEYVDGQIEERPAGENDHAAWQGAIYEWFAQNKASWGIIPRVELRMRVAPTRYRVPDVTILERARPVERIVSHPPLAVFEVLSPEDTVRRMLRKFADYHAMGIQEIWLLDPETRVFSRYSAGELSRRSEFSLGIKNIEFSLKRIEELVDSTVD
ncbi:MAG TPA: Uma2 family endonuclease [Acidisarcina sp.]